jgi:hypothetical protein
MTSFVYPALLTGLFMAALPVLIHLINMMRHRRVPWAAMEFLLVSQKKHRTWIIFKQLLLLLLRIVAIAAVVLMVARPLVRNQWGKWFGSTRTHHIVLLDDSYSMSDRWGDTSALEEAKGVIQQIGAEAARQVQPQQFTLLRFSRAQRVARGTQPDLLKETVDSEFAGLLRERLSKIAASQTAAGPDEALQAIGQLLGEGDDEQRIVYIVSDFRARQWEHPQGLRQQLLRLNQVHAQILLVNCVETARPNLAISGLTPGEGTRAVGVPLFVDVAVTNYGTAAAKNVSVLLEEDGHQRPAVRIEQIAPGKTVAERFTVNFSTAGQHVVQARLESDPVAADNFRCCVVDVPAQVPVLLIDGDPLSGDAKFVSAALAPGGAVRTGIGPRIETPRYLSLHGLESFASIYLMNIERLDDGAVAALEAYVKGGGGLTLFLGEKCSARFFNDHLYRDGQGLMPLPLTNPSELFVDRLSQVPDMEVTDHPMFRVFTGGRNSFLATVSIERYFATVKGWKPPVNSSVHVIARLRNGAPLAVERKFGQGRVVAVLTTAAPTWNNWAQGNPTFVVALQELQASLAFRPSAAYQVGAALRLNLDPAKYQAKLRFVTPQPGAASVVPLDAVPGPGGALVATFADTDVAGVYEAQITRTDGTVELRRWAVNVDPAEGDLKIVGAEPLAAHLEGVRYDYALASSFRYQDRQAAGVDLSRSLLYFLIVLLLVEQVLAWSASYHPPGRKALAGGGGSR